MANSYSFRNSSIDNFKVITWLLILLVTISPVITMKTAFAGAAEKWEILENTYDTTKKVVHLETRKISTDAANSGRYVVDVAVNAATLGSSLKNMLGIGLAVGAVTALVEGVGWVIDEGSVIKKPTSKPVNGYEWVYTDASNQTKKYFIKYQDFAVDYCASKGGFTGGSNFSWSGGILTGGVIKCGDGSQVGFSYVRNPYYDPNIKPEYVPVSDSELGSLALGTSPEPNAPTSPNAPLIQTAYDPNNPVSILAAVDSNDALDSANPQPESDPFANVRPTPNVDTNDDGINDAFDPSAPSLGEEIVFPKFCEWAPAVCDFFSWVKEKPDSDLGDVDVTQLNIQLDDSQIINFGNSCPAPETVSFSFMGRSESLEFSYQPLCQFMDMIRPFVIAASYLIGAYIVMGLSRGSGD